MINKFKKKYNLAFLDDLKKNPEIEIYVFGGAIRDIILGRPWKEIDLRIVYNRERDEREAEVERLLEAYNLEGKTRIDNQNLTVYRFLPAGSNTDVPIDLSLVPTIKDNLPDFTINSIFYDLKSEKIVDSYDGQKDLANKIIRTVKDPNIQFKDEPHMIFRALKFSCQLDFDIEPQTLAAIKENSSEVQNTFNFIKDNKEGIFVELFLGNIFKGLKDNPLRYFGYLNQTGLFNEFIQFYSSASSLSAMNDRIIEVKDLGSYEKNISYLFSEVIRAFEVDDRVLHFNRLIDLLAVSAPKKYSDFVIDTELLSYL